MKPAVYVDIRPTDGSATPADGNNIFALLHGAFRTLTQHRYALAIPGLYMPAERRPKRGEDMRFSRLRVFAESMEALAELNAAIVADNVQFLFPKAVPSDYTGQWGVFKRFRIPARRAERHTDGMPLRLRRMLQAEERGLLYFNVESKTNRTRFRLNIELVPLEPAVITVGEAADSYGFSSKERMVPLPLLP